MNTIYNVQQATASFCIKIEGEVTLYKIMERLTNTASKAYSKYQYHIIRAANGKITYALATYPGKKDVHIYL